MTIGNLPEVLSRAILVWRILVGRLGAAYRSFAALNFARSAAARSMASVGRPCIRSAFQRPRNG